MAVKRYMTAKPITVRPEDSLWDALHVLRSHHIRHLPVVQKKRLVGMLSDRDLRLLLPSSLAVLEEQERFRAWGAQVKVADVMTRKVFAVTPDMRTDQAAQLMVEHRIGCLPVLRGASLIGIISTIDLLRAMTDKHLLPGVPAEQTTSRERKTRSSRPRKQTQAKRVRRR
jgi:acetoin utilization protein AcuB